MTPDQIAQIAGAVATLIEPSLEGLRRDISTVSGKTDKMFSKIGKVETDVALMAQKQGQHESHHVAISENREITCPTRPIADRNAADIDALAGTVRVWEGEVVAVKGDVAILKEWRDKRDDSDDVSAAVVNERLRPLRVVWRNAEKIAAAILIAAAVKILVG